MQPTCVCGGGETQPGTSLKKLLSSLLFYLSSLSLKKVSDILDRSESTTVTDGKVIYRQAPVQQYDSQGYKATDI